MKTDIRTQRDLDLARCAVSFHEFVRQAWHVIEPETPFIDGWAIGAMAEHLQAVTEGQIKRLLINVPPGMSKSTVVNKLWTPWEWGPREKPGIRTISASYALKLSIRDLRISRSLLQSDWYQNRWPIKFVKDEDTKSSFWNVQQGFRQAASTKSALTGERGDRIIVDDPHSVKHAESDVEREAANEWFTNTVSTRLNDPSESAIVVIMQRLHMRDLTGLILDEMAEDFVHLCLPMYYEPARKCSTPVVWKNPESEWETFTDPRETEGELLFAERFPGDALDRMLRQMSATHGKYAESSQFQQRPIPKEGGLFKTEDFRYVDAPPSDPEKTIRGWDFAATESQHAAYTASVRMSIDRDGAIYIEDVVRERVEPLGLKRLLHRVAHSDGPDVTQSIPQDPGQAGKFQVREFVSDPNFGLHGLHVVGSPEQGDKVKRAVPLSAQVAFGNVYLVRATWNRAFVDEAGNFPSGYKDQIDAASRAYSGLVGKKKRAVSSRPPVVYRA